MIKNRDSDDSVPWDQLGLEILKNLGVKEGKSLIKANAMRFPKGSFSARFYREVIRLSLASVDL